VTVKLIKIVLKSIIIIKLRLYLGGNARIFSSSLQPLTRYLAQTPAALA